MALLTDKELDAINLAKSDSGIELWRRIIRAQDAKSKAGERKALGKWLRKLKPTEWSIDTEDKAYAFFTIYEAELEALLQGERPGGVKR